MSLHAFSSIVLCELIKEIQQLGKGIDLDDEMWAEAMTKKYHQATQEQPVVYLTDEENCLVGTYLALYEDRNVFVADKATQFIRDKHAADIRKFFRTKHDDRPTRMDGDSAEDMEGYLPRDDGAPACFKEWFAVYRVWRLTLAFEEIPFHVAADGTSGCRISHLPKSFEDKLDECLQITDASATVPAPKGYGLPITRKAINSVLITSDIDTSLPGFVSSFIIDRWFQILVSDRNRRKPGSTVFIHPDSLELVAATPQRVVESRALIDQDLDMMLFPTMFQESEEQHCILLVAFPKKHMIVVYDPLGPASTKLLEEKHPWTENYYYGGSQSELPWVVKEKESPVQGEDDVCGIFMFINALCVCLEEEPGGMYTQKDIVFLRRYIAAVICMGTLPEPVLKKEG